MKLETAVASLHIGHLLDLSSADLQAIRNYLLELSEQTTSNSLVIPRDLIVGHHFSISESRGCITARANSRKGVPSVALSYNY